MEDGLDRDLRKQRLHGFDVNLCGGQQALAERLAELGECLLTPTKIYVKPMQALFAKVTVKAVSHVTGGGFYENIPRMLKAGLTAKIDRAALKIPPIFELLQKTGAISDHDMFNTFNMGVGMCLAVAGQDAQKALDTLKEAGEDAYALGEIVPGDEGVVLC